MDPPTPSSTSRAGRRAFSADDLRELYELVRGSPYANAVVQARDAFEVADFVAALELIQTVRRQYEPRHQRILHQHEAGADKKSKKQSDPKTEARMDKIRRALELLASITPSLQRLAKAQPAADVADEPVAVRPQPVEEAAPSRIDTGQGLSAEFIAEFADAATPAEQLAITSEHCDVSPVTRESEILPGAYYRLQLQGKVHLVRTSATEQINDLVPIRHGLTDQPLKPLAKQVFLDLGRKQQLERIVPRTADAAARLPAAAGSEQGGMGLNMGDFSQLMDAAQRSGLVPNAEVIGHLRDREFRLGDYQKALQDMENLFGKFFAAAAQREQRLRREETDIKSGKIKMSARELQQKRARDEADSQRIARARRRFQRVIEGLRMLTSQHAGERSS